MLKGRKLHASYQLPTNNNSTRQLNYYLEVALFGLSTIKECAVNRLRG